MKDHSALAFSVLLILTLGFSSISLTNAIIGYPVYRLPGVKAGDWATYAFSLNISNTDPYPPPTPPSPLWEVDRARIEILSLESTNVTLNLILYYQNGTEYNSQTQIIDVNSGTAFFDNMTAPDQTAGPIIGANLTAGDQIFINAYSGTINETVEGNYAGSQREVNHFQNRLEQGDLTQEIDFYWDRISGIMVSLNMTTTLLDIDGYTRMTEIVMIAETSIWQPTSVPLKGDVNQDGIVNLFDLMKVVMAFGSDPAVPSWNPACDLNGDNIINTLDLTIVATHFGQTAQP